MKSSLNIGVNMGNASMNINPDQGKPGKKKRSDRETDSGIDPPEPEESLVRYLDRNGIDVPYLRDLLRIYTSHMRMNEADILLDITGIEQMVEAIQRGDTIEATEIFVSFCLKK